MHVIRFLLAFLTVASLVAIGYGVAVGSALGIILSIIGVLVFMGLGFSIRKKLMDGQKA